MKVSILTVNLNNAAGLKATLESVAMQTCREFEHIIIDGGSLDGSVPVIKSYEEQIIANRTNTKTIYPMISWMSEKDKGIYDGMNKGVKKASGEYVYFLNSGDTLATEDTIQEMIDAIDDSDFVIGRVNKSYQGRVVGQTDMLSEEDMSLYQMFLHGINHQAALIKRPLLVTTPYDVNVRLSADWKFFVQKIVLENASVKFVDITFANFDMSGVSSNADTLRRERMQILETFVPKRIARDYLAIAPHYYEVIRVQWLLKHPLWYKFYRWMTTLGRKIMRE